MNNTRYDIRFMLTEQSGLVIALERLFARNSPVPQGSNGGTRYYPHRKEHP